MPAAPKVYQFEVTGSGRFPFDMLRYDQCWPSRESEDSYSGLGATDVHVTPRTVRLNTIRPSPTTGRWESFGWRVTVPAKLLR